MHHHKLVADLGLHIFERGWLSSNGVLLLSQEQAALVDSGYAIHSPLTLTLLEQVLATRPLDLLLNTHLHSDHCGGNAALQQRYPGLRTLIPPGQARHVRDWDPVALSYQPTGQICPMFRHDGVLTPGQEIQLGRSLWQVHAAPGHDPHSVILFEPVHRILISADALWENGFGVVFPELDGVQAFDEVAQTLDLIENLSPQLIIPGHGRPFEDLGTALDSARRRLEGFIQNPVKHAMHAAKVLLKFKLLERQSIRTSDLQAWAVSTTLLQMHHRHFAQTLPFDLWLEQLMQDLVRAKVAQFEGECLVNA